MALWQTSNLKTKVYTALDMVKRTIRLFHHKMEMASNLILKVSKSKRELYTGAMKRYCSYPLGADWDKWLDSLSKELGF